MLCVYKHKHIIRFSIPFYRHFLFFLFFFWLLKHGDFNRHHTTPSTHENVYTNTRIRVLKYENGISVTMCRRTLKPYAYICIEKKEKWIYSYFLFFFLFFFFCALHFYSIVWLTLDTQYAHTHTHTAFTFVRTHLLYIYCIYEGNLRILRLNQPFFVPPAPSLSLTRTSRPKHLFLLM